MLDPLVAMNDDGGVVVWAESAAPLATGERWLHSRAATVWAARYTVADGWSRPERVYVAAASGGIDLRRSGDLVVDESGEFHAVFLDGINPSTLVQLSLGRERRIDTLPIRVAWDLTASRAPHGELVAAYAGIDFQSNRSGVVFFTGRTPAGSWREATPVTTGPDGEEASELVIASHGTRLSLLWRHAIGIVHYWSTDSGLTWQRGNSLHHANVSDLRAASDDCGNLHVVFVNWLDEARPTIGYAVIGPTGQWNDQVSLFPRVQAIQPGIGVHSDRIVVVASAKEPLDVSGSSFRPLIVERNRLAPRHRH